MKKFMAARQETDGDDAFNQLNAYKNLQEDETTKKKRLFEERRKKLLLDIKSKNAKPTS